MALLADDLTERSGRPRAQPSHLPLAAEMDGEVAGTLHPTADGRALLPRLRAVAKAHEDGVTTALSAGERLLPVELPRKVADQQGLTPGVHPGSTKLPPAT